MSSKKYTPLLLTTPTKPPPFLSALTYPPLHPKPTPRLLEPPRKDQRPSSEQCGTFTQIFRRHVITGTSTTVQVQEINGYVGRNDACCESTIHTRIPVEPCGWEERRVDGRMERMLGRLDAGSGVCRFAGRCAGKCQCIECFRIVIIFLDMI